MWCKLAFFCILYLAKHSVDCGPIGADQKRESHPSHGGHDHSQHAVRNCDDTRNGIGIDWDGDDDKINPDFYKCNQKRNYYSFDLEPFAQETCKTPPHGSHHCLSEKIEYSDNIPVGGPHRPVWVTYGEYEFMPPQRWVHAIEHGAAVFLYDPCADPDEISKLKSIAKGCLRRHVITPYKNLPNGELFGVVTFGCRLGLNAVSANEDTIKDYLKRHAIKDGPEFILSENGQYNFGIIQKAQIVSDFNDTKICPN